MKRFLITLVFCPLLLLPLSGCAVSSTSATIATHPLLIVAESIMNESDALQEKNWEEKLRDKTNIDAAANCIFNQKVLADKKELAEKPPFKLWTTYKTQCVQTVLDAWADVPENHRQVVTVISANMVLARDAEEQGNTEEAKRLRLKALGYLKQDAFVLREANGVPGYDDKRVEYTDQYNGTGFIYNNELIYTLLSDLKILDRESQVCVYPRALESVFADPKFKGTNFLRAACSDGIELLDRRKWKLIWDDESYTKHKKAISEDPCEEIKRYKPIGQGVLVLSSHADGKGLIYTGEPYKVYQDGCLVKKTVTNDKGELIFDYADESFYVLEFFFRKQVLTERPAVLRPLKKK